MTAHHPSFTMKFGLVTPAVTLFPGRHAAWERDAGPVDLQRIAQAADALGYHHLTCSDHVAIDANVAKVRGGTYYDPFSTLGFFAAITQRIRLVTHVLVLPYYHPLEVAKRLGTLDRLSGGRVIAGLGVGTLREEFELLGAEFEGRGERYEDALRALRASLGKLEPEYHGTHYDFADVVIDPCALQPRLPIWLGGRTPRSLRRALLLGDGWDPFGLTFDQLRALLDRAREWPEWRDRAQPFELVLAPEQSFEVGNEDGVERALETVESYRQIGATVLNLRFEHGSLQGYVEALECFMARTNTQTGAGIELAPGG